jgi:hypothetical protein
VIRPELRRAARRWREALAGAGLAACGAAAAAGSGGLLAAAGWLALAAGIGLGIVGIQRGRFRRPGTGPGVVQVVEGQVAYFGPYAGGTVALPALLRIDLDPGDGTGPVWILTAAGQAPLAIPAGALGADALFDAFATLEGLGTERMLAALARPGTVRRAVWQAPRTRLADSAAGP